MKENLCKIKWWTRFDLYRVPWLHFAFSIDLFVSPAGSPGGSFWTESGQHDHQTEESHLDGRAEGEMAPLVSYRLCSSKFTFRATSVDSLVWPSCPRLCRTLSWMSWGKPLNSWRSRTLLPKRPLTESSTHLNSHLKEKGRVRNTVQSSDTSWQKTIESKLQSWTKATVALIISLWSITLSFEHYVECHLVLGGLKMTILRYEWEKTVCN